MDEGRDFALTEMRKCVEKLGSSAEVCGDPTLMRFLIARSMEPDKAAKMFVQWQKWRAALVPNGFISDSEVPDELEARKIFLQGLSQDKYPVMIVQASRHFPSKDQIQFKKFVVHLLDKTIASAFKGREIGNEKLIGILDLQNISYKNIDARGLITGFQFLQAYYPERLAKCYILHMPWFFLSVWRLVSHFLEKATLEKIHTKRRNKLAQQRLNDLVFVKYNQALKARHDKQDVNPISLDDIDKSNEWLISKRVDESNIDEDAENELVFGDDNEGLRLTRGEVARAAGVEEASKNTRSQARKARSKAKATIKGSKSLPSIEEDNSEDIENDVEERYQSNEGRDESDDNYGTETDDDSMDALLD